MATTGTGRSGTPRIREDQPIEGVVRITLTRPEVRNAQDERMLRELDAALSAASGDSSVRVIVVAAAGPDFSAGHDLKEERPYDDEAGHEPLVEWESEAYLGLCWRWRNLPKPTVVQVQGRAIAGGLMLIWPFDLVVASDDAEFRDPVTAFGVNGHEFFAHVWELGARRAKDILFTGRAISAGEAHALGMVSRVVPRAQLEAATLELAARIATRPSFGLRLAKASVNQSLDAQGQWSALQSAFALHQLGHANNRVRFGDIVDPAGMDTIRAEGRRG